MKRKFHLIKYQELEVLESSLDWRIPCISLIPLYFLTLSVRLNLNFKKKQHQSPESSESLKIDKNIKKFSSQPNHESRYLEEMMEKSEELMKNC